MAITAFSVHPPVRTRPVISLTTAAACGKGDRTDFAQDGDGNWWEQAADGSWTCTRGTGDLVDAAGQRRTADQVRVR